MIKCLFSVACAHINFFFAQRGIFNRFFYSQNRSCEYCSFYVRMHFEFEKLRDVLWKLLKTQRSVSVPENYPPKSFFMFI